MATIHRGASLEPHFRDFLPAWVAAQDWYTGDGVPELTLVGSFRFEDPAGEVGVETQLVSDGSVVYHVPMTYRGAPRPGENPEDGLITTAEHSVLGTRWIYDAPTDPVWVAGTLRLIREGTSSDEGTKLGVGAQPARGELRRPVDGDTVLDIVRTPGEGAPDGDPAGVLLATWHPDGPDSPGVTGCVVSLREAS